MASTSNIYTGFWVNHSRGQLLGATITLSNRNSAFLLALLAIVVAIAGNSFWRIVSYTAHQIRSNEGPHDAIFYQQQAILKNSGSALGAAWRFSKLSFAWRQHGRFWRSSSLLLILSAVLLGSLFAVASLFSSQVTKASNSAVLVDSPHCGYWEFEGDTAASVFSWDLKTLNESIASANYASQCYGTDHKSNAQCGTYPVPEIQWVSHQNSSCPSANGTCLFGNTAAYEMDTGPMDSNSVLGLNAPLSERITLRKLAVCAPLHLAPYVQILNKTIGDSSIVDEYIDVYIGGIQGTSENWTYEYNTHSALVSIGYDFQSISSQAGGLVGWQPIDDFNRTDADVSVFFLAANGVSYIHPNTDPLFGAESAYNFTYGSDNGVVTEYDPNFLVTSLGCTDQYQICNPAQFDSDGNPLCTQLQEINGLPQGALQINLNEYQVATVETVVFALRASNMFNSVNGRGSSALKAQNTVFTLTQVANLTNTQWQIEVDGWFAISLASIQQYLLEAATGPTDVLNSGGTILPPTNDFNKAICKRQMVRNISGYQNFSTLGVSIILIAGSILVIIGLSIDKVIGLFQKYAVKDNFGRLSWTSDGYLQLQRFGYEGAGYDGWSKCDDDIPVMTDQRRLGGLDIYHPDHPRLVRAGGTVSSPMDLESPMDSVKMGLLVHQRPVSGSDASSSY